MDCSYTNQRRAMMGCPQKVSPVMMNPDFTTDNCSFNQMPPLMPANQMQNRVSPAMPASKPAGTASCHNCPGSTPGCIENYPIGIGYVPWQQWNQTYALDRGLQRGTIFPELDLPFVMGRCR